MLAPPPFGDYYPWQTAQVRNPGTSGAADAFNDMRQFWGTAAPQYWAEMDAIIQPLG